MLVSQLFSNRLKFIQDVAVGGLLNQCLQGVERECLRVSTDGNLAQTPHPKMLGSALTNQRITTDYSESLLEFVTPTEHAIDPMLQGLLNTHVFTSQALQSEFLWSASMPCPLPDEKDIPIAYYGNSLAGRVRHIYRRGLALRYGKTMQCIAGIHYNFSLPEAFWPMLQKFEGNQLEPSCYQSEQYIAIIRNFRRFSWLLMYLFGASPAVDASFMANYPHHQLQTFDKNTFYLPYATSLRMSDLGYQSKAQSGLTPCYDDLSTYINSLTKAIETPYPAYEKLGIKKNGEWIQLNANILQIENEYYSSIRPKRVVKPGERPIDALRRAGIQYIEVRCMDINPFLPLGIEATTGYFLNSFLLYCLMQENTVFSNHECLVAKDNFLSTVKEGRNPQLRLQRHGGTVLLSDWANTLLDEIAPIASVLDKASHTDKYTAAVHAQMEKVKDPHRLPSAQVITAMQEQQQSFAEFSLQQSLRHHHYFQQQSLSPDVKAQYITWAKQSLEQQKELEQHDQGQSLDRYIAEYVNAHQDR